MKGGVMIVRKVILMKPERCKCNKLEVIWVPEQNMWGVWYGKIRSYEWFVKYLKY